MQLLKIPLFDVKKPIFCLLCLLLSSVALLKKAKKKNSLFTVSRDSTFTYIQESSRVCKFL